MANGAFQIDLPTHARYTVRFANGTTDAKLFDMTVRLMPNFRNAQRVAAVFDIGVDIARVDGRFVAGTAGNLFEVISGAASGGLFNPSLAPKLNELFVAAVAGLPGPPPRVTAEATLAVSKTTAVTPVARRASCAWPTRTPGKSVMRLWSGGTRISAARFRRLPAARRCAILYPATAAIGQRGNRSSDRALAMGLGAVAAHGGRQDRVAGVELGGDGTQRSDLQRAQQHWRTLVGRRRLRQPQPSLGASGAPTGTVFNTFGGKNGGFQVSGFDKTGKPVSAPAIFLFATEDGTIVGWNPGVNPKGFDPAKAGTYGIIAVDNSANPTAADGAVYKGQTIATGVVTPTFSTSLNSQALATWGNEYDTAKATSLLQSAGYHMGSDGIMTNAAGQKLQFTVINIGGYSDWVASMQVIQQNLKAIGIQLTPSNLAAPAFNAALYSGKYQLAYYDQQSFGPGPYYELRNWLDSHNTAPIGKTAVSNYERYINPAVDKLLLTYAGTTSTAEQHSIVNQLEQVMLTQLPVIPVVEAVDWYQYDTGSFSGWPTPGNPYAQPSAYAFPDNEQVLLHLSPK